MRPILLVKLADGTELIGDIIEDSKTHIRLLKPLQIHYRYFMGGIPHVSFSRYMMFTAEPFIVIDTRHIMAIAPARKAFVDYYNESVDDYFGGIEQLIDNELITALSSSQKDEQMKKILETMPIDKASVN